MGARRSVELRSVVLPGLLLAGACLGISLASGSWLLMGLPPALAYLWIMFHHWKLAWWILLAVIPFSAEIILNGGKLATSLPDEPMSWLFLLLLPALLLLKPALLPLKALASPVVAIIALQLVWVIVAVACSPEPMLSLKYLLVRVWMLAAFFVFPMIIFKTKDDFVTGFRVLLVPVTASILIILLRHAALGFEFMQINPAIGWLYDNHVEYSTIISMVFPLVCLAWTQIPGMRAWLRIGLAAVIALFVAAILFSYARAAILAVVFAFIVGAGIRYRFARLIVPALYIVVIAVMGYMIREHRYLDFQPDYEQTYMHHDLNAHIGATFSGRDMSGMERVYRWIAAVRMSRERPLTGVGPNRFVREYKSYTVPAFRTYVSDNEEQSTTHNYFLYMLTEQGWPAMLLYGALVVVVISVAQGAYHRFRDPFYKACTLALTMMFAAAFVNNFFSELTDTHKVGALFYISIALILVLAMKSREDLASP